MSEEIRTVLMTVPDPSTGETLARRLVEERLAACGNVIPGVVSVYRWKGAVQRDEEALVLFKTTADRVSAFVEMALEIHPYEVPEILSLPVEDGHRAYMEWVGEETRTP